MIDPNNKIVYVSPDNSGDFNITDSYKSSTQNIINKAIEYAYKNKYTTVKLLEGTYVINNPVEIYSGIELVGEGKDKTCIKLINNAALDTKSLFYITPSMRNPAKGANTIMTPLIWAVGSTGNKCAGANDISIHDFEIDVNYENNAQIRLGRGYFNCIQLYNSKNVRIYNMYMHDGHGDGVRIVNSSDVQVYNSKFYKLGHDTVFFIRSDNCHHYGNICVVRTNSGGRCNDCTNSSIHNNVIYAWSTTDWSAGGPGIQIEKQYKSAISVEVTNNLIFDMFGCGIWCARNSAAVAESGKSKVNINHNTIYNCGINKIYYQGGIVIDGIHNVYFDNNIVDGCYGHGVVCMGMTDTTVSKVKVNTYIRNNIIINTKVRKYLPAGTGFGIHNRYTSTHVMTCSNNCVYNNISGNYKNVKSSNDINADPMLVDSKNHNYLLKSNSPCITAGYDKSYIGIGIESDSSSDTPDETPIEETPTDDTEDPTEVISEPTDDTTTPVTTTVKTIYPIYNNRLKRSVPTAVLKSDTFTDIGGLGKDVYRGLVYFDLSGFNNTNIVSATMYLYWYYPVNTKRTNDTVVEVYRAFPYTPAYASWNTRKQNLNWITVGGDWYDKNDTINGNVPLDIFTLKNNTVPSNSYYSLNVTELVKKYINGTFGNTGFFIKVKDESNNYVAFYNGNIPATNKKMKMMIEYIE